MAGRVGYPECRMKEVPASQISRQVRNMLAFAAVVLFLFVLKAASEVTLQIALALLVFAFVNPLVERLTRLKVPNIVAITLALALVVVIFFGFIYILILMVNMLVDRMPYYAERIRSLDALLSSYLVEYIPDAGEDFSILGYVSVDWYGLATSWLGSFSSKVISIFSDAMMVFVTLIFLLLERMTFLPKIAFAFPRDKSQKFSSMLGRINRQMTKYLLLKLVISLITGFLYYLTALVTGLDFALVWGVLATLLNFIPTIGSIIVTALTIIMAIIQFAPTAWMNVVYVIILTVSIEMILGNIIDPRIQGVQLNMSPLMILISLSVWGYIWGPDRVRHRPLIETRRRPALLRQELHKGIPHAGAGPQAQAQGPGRGAAPGKPQGRHHPPGGGQPERGLTASGRLHKELECVRSSCTSP